MKQAINNLKDYAELAWASYFNFDYIKEQKADDYKISQTRFFKNKDDLENLEYFKALYKNYNEYLIIDDSFVIYPKLNGEFSELQAKNFSQRYEVKFHQPNTTSGFSATLFYDKEKGKFVVGFRGKI
ncbi:hypothetical protein [Campylobacter helveticus]|uniref:Uncharacterized protein n=1 Tax=Campylobacter helveticus TaxID=28898 RepID=A0AAX2UFV5_9BACT|nr:hypothetical protein [Campylobacter helveticus]ARE80278.1 hypothetical protein CHELV3228_0661 [Campylobacter helveticus]MCR2055575.1 hypothetical protein [Campylobacter helveticus]MCR2063243.1 hypothetical protein [Campylobacter helveticus]TNB54439.1 hypothetical protein FDW42_10290 [Campylobacter helveticus]TXK54336.1 hypothetical protein A9726_04595 [Campylobacter helveticus]